MKRGYDRGRPAREQGDGEHLAIKALSFLASDPDRIDRFLSLSGLDHSTLRQAAQAPTFLLAVLDYMVGDEPLLLAFAAQEGIPPEGVVTAHDALRKAGDRPSRQ